MDDDIYQYAISYTWNGFDYTAIRDNYEDARIDRDTAMSQSEKYSNVKIVRRLRVNDWEEF